MSKNIIVDYLLGGKLDEKMTMLTPEAQHLITIICEQSDKLTATLFEEQQKVLFKSYCDAELAYRLEQLDYYFSEGFKAGILMGLEINAIT